MVLDCRSGGCDCRPNSRDSADCIHRLSAHLELPATFRTSLRQRSLSRWPGQGRPHPGVGGEEKAPHPRPTGSHPQPPPPSTNKLPPDRLLACLAGGRGTAGVACSTGVSRCAPPPAPRPRPTGSHQYPLTLDQQTPTSTPPPNSEAACPSCWGGFVGGSLSVFLLLAGVGRAVSGTDERASGERTVPDDAQSRGWPRSGWNAVHVVRTETSGWMAGGVPDERASSERTVPDDAHSRGKSRSPRDEGQAARARSISSWKPALSRAPR